MGRQPHLTPEQAEEVRELYRDEDAEWTIAALAHSFGVTTPTIRAALKRTGAYRRQPPHDPSKETTR